MTQEEISTKGRNMSYAAGALVILAFMFVGQQVFSLKEGQQKLALENARLSGMAEAHSETLASHATQMQETTARVDINDAKLTEVSVKVQAQDQKLEAHSQTLEQQAKDIRSVRRQVKDLKDTPATNVVVAATDDSAKKEAFDNWAKHHPDWKSRRSCMKSQMNQNPGISLTDAYNSCG